LLVGLAMPDDAAVWRLDDTRALVITLDFFTPVVDDPYDYGAIAAANALSDLYAMGAQPMLALNVAAMPARLPVEILSTILRGGAEKVREAGAVLAGGHSVQDEEPKYGLVAVGMVPQECIMTKAGARAGDIIVLSKPLGTGVTTTALKRGTAQPSDVDRVTKWMSQLNAAAAALSIDVGIRTATDVTGFSLLGHAVEMSEASDVRLQFSLPSIPFIGGTPAYGYAGNFPGGSADNRLFFSPNVKFDLSVDEIQQMLLFDAQTSGGLLLSVPESRFQEFSRRASEQGLPLWPIGRVVPGTGVEVISAPLSPEFHPTTTEEEIEFLSSGSRN